MKRRGEEGRGQRRTEARLREIVILLKDNKIISLVHALTSVKEGNNVINVFKRHGVFGWIRSAPGANFEALRCHCVSFLQEPGRVRVRGRVVPRSKHTVFPFGLFRKDVEGFTPWEVVFACQKRNQFVAIHGRGEGKKWLQT